MYNIKAIAEILVKSPLKDDQDLKDLQDPKSPAPGRRSRCLSADASAQRARYLADSREADRNIAGALREAAQRQETCNGCGDHTRGENLPRGIEASRQGRA
jgi:hypothetical protein